MLIIANEVAAYLEIKRKGISMWGRIVSFFNERGEGTAWDLDYGKLIIIGLCLYIAVMVSGCHTIGVG